MRVAPSGNHRQELIQEEPIPGRRPLEGFYALDDRRRPRNFTSALHERVKGRDESMLVSPIKWASVTFIPTDHMMLTCHPTFINNALFQILEDPTPQPVGGKAKRFARTAVAASRATVRGFKHPIH